MLKKSTLLLFGFLFLQFSVFAQKNISFLGNLKFPGKTLAGVWQYIDSIGNEYALVGTSDGLAIVDITNPASPNLLFDVPAVGSLWREVKTYSHYAYVTTEGGGGVTIVDMDSLPLAVNYKTYTGDGVISGLLGKSHSLQIEGDYLYINGPTGLANGGILICSLADPWNPTYVGEENLFYVHDCFVRNDTLWASEVYKGQFSVFDITDKTTPVLLATQFTPGAFNHNAWLSDNGQYLFTTDEKVNAPLGVFDVSDLNNIKQVDLYYTNLNPDAEVHNVRVINDFLINPSYGDSTYGSQLTICDAARPQNVIEIGNYPLGGPKNGLSLSWDASPYLPSGNIIATDVDSGLFILAPTYIRGCYLEGVVTDSITGALLNNVFVEILTTPVMDSTILTGEYKVGLADAGIYSVSFSKPGYQTKTINNVSLSNGNLTTLNIQLWDGTVGVKEELFPENLITIAPNPFNGSADVIINSELINQFQSLQFVVTDMCGREVLKTSITEKTTIVIDGNDFESGLYFYSLYTNSTLLKTGKLIKQN